MGPPKRRFRRWAYKCSGSDALKLHFPERVDRRELLIDVSGNEIITNTVLNKIKHAPPPRLLSFQLPVLPSFMKKYLLGIYAVPSTAPGTRDKTMRTGKSCSQGADVPEEGTTVKKVNKGKYGRWEQMS